MNNPWRAFVRGMVLFLVAGSALGIGLALVLSELSDEVYHGRVPRAVGYGLMAIFFVLLGFVMRFTVSKPYSRLQKARKARLQGRVQETNGKESDR